MSCTDPQLVVCELDAIAELMTQWDWNSFVATLVATLAGAAVALLGAWWVYRRESAERDEAERTSRRRSAITTLQTELRVHARDLWNHQMQLSAAKIAGAGNRRTSFGQFDPPPPRIDALLIAISEVKPLFATEDEESLGELERVVRAIEGEDWEDQSAALTHAAELVAQLSI